MSASPTFGWSWYVHIWFPPSPSGYPSLRRAVPKRFCCLWVRRVCWPAQAANNPATARVKDGVTTNEYESEELSDATLQRVVEQAYKTFRVRPPLCGVCGVCVLRSD